MSIWSDVRTTFENEVRGSLSPFASRYASDFKETAYPMKAKPTDEQATRVRLNNNDPSRPDRMLWKDAKGEWHESLARKPGQK
ncbi:hypothetical protein [Candidatus Solirubrobacter pratensis]|uniref:hypothetical protein n=1 Tax=Candidatus Solirubrobacter pratensis TaxID=1298857 RepID=UPI0004154030|nr:hypothetical protein [Candidatus Solirubrobacter pratensis]